MTSESLAPAEKGGASRRVGGAAGILMVSILLSRVLGLVRDRVVAHQFGQSLQTDVYNAAFTIPDLIQYLIAGGALSSAFIPVFTDYMTQNKRREAWRLFSMVASMTILAVGGLVCLAEIITPFLVKVTNDGYSREAIAQTVPLARILLPAQVFFFLGGLMGGVLQVKNNFIGPALGSVIYNVGIIFGGLFLYRTFGIAGLCWGALIGAFLGNVVLQWILVRKEGGHYDPFALQKYWGHTGAKEVWRNMIPILLGFSLPQVSILVNKYFASFLLTGELSALMNANRLMQVPLGVFAQAIGIAVFPKIALLSSLNDRAAARREANGALRFTYFLTFPASLLMIVLALPVVQLLLQSGKFKSVDAEIVAQALIYYSIGIFAWSLHSVSARIFYAVKDTRTPIIVGTIITLFVFIPLNAILMKYMGYRGLALATTLAAILNMAVTVYLLRFRLKGLEGGRMLRSMAKITAASFAMAGGAVLARNVLQALFPTRANHSPLLSSALVLTGSLAVSLTIFGLLAVFLRMEEVNFLRPLLRKFTKRKR